MQLGAGEAVGFQEVFLQLSVCFGRVFLGEFRHSGPVVGGMGGEVELQDFGDLRMLGISLFLIKGGKGGDGDGDGDDLRQ